MFGNNMMFSAGRRFLLIETLSGLNGAGYDVLAVAVARGWNKVQPLVAEITVSANALLATNRGAGAAVAAFYAAPASVGLSALPPGSRLRLVNLGAVIGGGGAGGEGGIGGLAGGGGYAGGPAVYATVPLEIDNRGTIGGGAGGGGGGGGGANSGGGGGGGGGGTHAGSAGGAGAGGTNGARGNPGAAGRGDYGTTGQGNLGGTGTGGTGGTPLGGGATAGGTGGAGGTPGQRGANGNAGVGSSPGAGGAGGEAGSAVVGGAITWINNGTVLGAISNS